MLGRSGEKKFRRLATSIISDMGNLPIMLTKKYQSEQETVEQKIQALKAALAAEKETVENAEKWIALIKECDAPIPSDRRP